MAIRHAYPKVPTTGCVDPAVRSYRTFDFTVGHWHVAVASRHGGPTWRLLLEADCTRRQHPVRL